MLITSKRKAYSQPPLWPRGMEPKLEILHKIRMKVRTIEGAGLGSILTQRR